MAHPTTSKQGSRTSARTSSRFASDERGKGAILLVDRASGNASAITLWEDEQAMQASEESANALRAQAAEQMGAAGQPDVARYEVAVFET